MRLETAGFSSLFDTEVMVTMLLDSASRLTSQEAVGSGRISTIKNPTARGGGKEHKAHFPAPIDISCGYPSIKGCKRMVRLVPVIRREYFSRGTAPSQINENKPKHLAFDEQ